MSFLSKRAFTLIELLVVIAIISILAGIVLANVGQGAAQARDAERKADLRNVETALERYRLKNGRYPEACNGPTTSFNQTSWSGQIDSQYRCANNTGQYIVGLAPEFISVLPNDPQLNGSQSGYVYAVDPEGKVYKFMALNTVESETVEPTDDFSRCGDTSVSSQECAAVPSSPGDGGAYNSSGSRPAHCYQQSEMGNDYAVRAGFAMGGTYGGSYVRTEKAREYFSDIIRCK
ncbi:hypothetical protein CL638_01120 [bacterium]|nr:hypothetical protein [bacterium]